MSDQPPDEPRTATVTPAVAAEQKARENNNDVVLAPEAATGTDASSSDRISAHSPQATSLFPVTSTTSDDQPREAHDQTAPSTTTRAEPSVAGTSIKAELTDSVSVPDAGASDIQQGYVLVAHPDAEPSGGGGSVNIGKSVNQTPMCGHQQQPQVEDFMQDSTNVDEHGQEVEHYDPSTPPARIQAYARLEFPFFNFYIQKLSVTIGRRPPVSRGGSMPPKSQVAPEVFEPPEEATKESKGAEAAPWTQEDDLGVERAIRVKKEEEEKDVPALSAPEKPDAEQQLSVKPEESPRKASTWEDKDTIGNDEDVPNSAAAPPTSVATIVDEPPPVLPTDGSAPISQVEPSQQATKSDKMQVDVDLGSIKAVSRNHARLFFDSTINPRSGLTNSWSLEVKGRNGLVLDGQWRAKGEVCRLKNGSRIQIAERIFHFVLPNGVGYPTAPPSPIMDEYYEGQPYGYPPTPERSQSPIIYGSDSDELRSGSDDYGYDYDGDDVDGSGQGSMHGQDQGPVQLDENGQPIKRKRGRPKKQRTAEQIAAIELERQRRLDPTIPRRPRGRPPKQKKEDEPQHSTPPTPIPLTQLQPIPYATQRVPAPDIPVPPLPPPDGSQLPPLPPQHAPQVPKPPIPLGGLDENGRPRLSKKEQAELRKAQRQAERDEKQRIREAEKKAKEEAKAAAKEAKAAEQAEKKRKEEERKKAAAEEAKRLQEEKQKAAERDKAEKEKQKAAAAAAAAELKAKTIADAQAKAKADASARAAKGDDKTKASGTGSEVKIRPAPPPQASVPVALNQSKKTLQPKSSQHSMPQSIQPPQQQQPQQPLQQQEQQQPQQSRTPIPKPFIPTNQFQGKSEKPPYSYPALIAQAIWSAPNRQAPLQHIHMWIPDKYPFFRDPAHAQILAQAIKQNLAVNRAFVNIPLPSGIALWAVEPEQAKLFDGNTFLPPPSAQSMSYHPPLPQQPYYHQTPPLSNPPPQQHIPIQPQQQYIPMHSQQSLQHSPMPQQQHIPMHQPQQQQQYGTLVPMMSPPISQPIQHVANGMPASASPAPATVPMPVAPAVRHTPQPQPSPAPAPVVASPVPTAATATPAAPVPSSSSSSKMPILIARPSAAYVKPTPPTSTASISDPSTMLDPEGYPPIAINENKMFLSPIVFSALTAQQLSNLQSIDTKQALNILQAFVVNYFKTELKKRKKAEKAALRAAGAGPSIGMGGGTVTPMMSASPSPAPGAMKRHAPDESMTAGHEPKIQRVS